MGRFVFFVLVWVSCVFPAVGEITGNVISRNAFQVGGGAGDTGIDLDQDGNILADGNVSAGGDVTVGGTLAVNSGTLTSSASTFDLVVNSGAGTFAVFAATVAINDSNTLLDNTGLSTTGLPAFKTITSSAEDATYGNEFVHLGGNRSVMYIHHANTGTGRVLVLNQYVSATGNIFEAQLDGTNKFHIKANGDVVMVSALIRTPSTITTDTTPTAVGRALIIIGTWDTSNDITDFDNETAGQKLIIIGGDADCNVVDGAPIQLVGGTTWNGVSGATLEIISDGTIWYELSRSAT